MCRRPINCNVCAVPFNLKYKFSFLESVTFHREMFDLSNFGLVPSVGVINALKKFLRISFHKLLKTLNIRNVDKTIPCIFSSFIFKFNWMLTDSYHKICLIQTWRRKKNFLHIQNLSSKHIFLMGNYCYSPWNMGLLIYYFTWAFVLVMEWLLSRNIW